MTKVHNFISKLINIIFHPLCMITYVMVFFLYLNNFFNIIFPSNIKYTILGFVIVTTILIPLMCYLSLRYFNLFEGVNLKIQKLLITIFFSIIVFFTARSLAKIGLPFTIVRFLFFNSALLLVFALVTLIADINFSAIGIGELIGIYMCWMRYLIVDNIYIFVHLLLIFGLIGFSQIYLKKVKPLNYCLETLIGVFFAIFAVLF
jgi:hypothetical protein